MGEEQNEIKSTVIGVVNDFHFASLHRKVEPLVLRMRPRMLNAYYIKLQTRDMSGTLSAIERTFKTFVPEHPFQYMFLDERYEAAYRKEERMQQIFSYCAILAILIACLGLFGLASFMTDQRTKEIGIRKTLGASVTSIAILLSKEFAQWVLLANLIAWPVAWWIMTRWLQSFAYRISITPWVFGIAALTAFGIAVITVGGRTIKAALANPVKALRYE